MAIGCTHAWLPGTHLLRWDVFGAQLADYGSIPSAPASITPGTFVGTGWVRTWGDSSLSTPPFALPTPVATIGTRVQLQGGIPRSQNVTLFAWGPFSVLMSGTADAIIVVGGVAPLRMSISRSVALSAFRVELTLASASALLYVQADGARGSTASISVTLSGAASSLTLPTSADTAAGSGALVTELYVSTRSAPVPFALAPPPSPPPSPPPPGAPPAPYAPPAAPPTPLMSPYASARTLVVDGAAAHGWLPGCVPLTWQPSGQTGWKGTVADIANTMYPAPLSISTGLGFNDTFVRGGISVRGWAGSDTPTSIVATVPSVTLPAAFAIGLETSVWQNTEIRVLEIDIGAELTVVMRATGTTVRIALDYGSGPTIIQFTGVDLTDAPVVMRISNTSLQLQTGSTPGMHLPPISSAPPTHPNYTHQPHHIQSAYSSDPIGPIASDLHTHQTHRIRSAHSSASIVSDLHSHQPPSHPI